MSLDEDIFRFINLDMGNPFLDAIMVSFTLAGSIYIWLLVIIPLWFRGHRREALDLFFLLVLVETATLVTKYLVARERPIPLRELTFSFGVYSSDPSFPSGHTSRVFALSTLLSLNFTRWRPHLLAFASAVGLSRIYVGAHFPTDVLAGALLGILLGSILFIASKERPYVALGEKVIARIQGLIDKLIKRSQGLENLLEGF